MPKKEFLKFVLVLTSNPSQITRVEKFLERVNHRLRLDEVKFNKLFVATTEAVNNSIIHGNKRDSKKKVVLTCDVNNSNLIVRVHDDGTGVDTTRLPNPLDEKNLLRENGRGVFLMRSLMDSVEFVVTPYGAEVIMTMALDT